MQNGSEEESQHQSKIASQLGYWCDRLSHAPVLELPLDLRRPAQLSGRGHTVHFALDSQLVADIKALGAACRCTPFMCFLAAWQLLLCRYSRAKEAVVGIPCAARDHAEVHQLMGYFVNPLAQCEST